MEKGKIEFDDPNFKPSPQAIGESPFKGKFPKGEQKPYDDSEYQPENTSTHRLSLRAEKFVNNYFAGNPALITIGLDQVCDVVEDFAITETAALTADKERLQRQLDAAKAIQPHHSTDSPAPPEASTPNAAAVEANLADTYRDEILGLLGNPDTLNQHDPVVQTIRRVMLRVNLLHNLAATQPHTEVRETVDKGELENKARKFLASKLDSHIAKSTIGDEFVQMCAEFAAINIAADLEAGTMADKVREYEAMMEVQNCLLTDEAGLTVVKFLTGKWGYYQADIDKYIEKQDFYDRARFDTALEAYAALSEDKQTEEKK